MIEDEKIAYRYVLKQGGKVVERNWTYDLSRRGAECRGTHPQATLEPVGDKVTIKRARKWASGKRVALSPLVEVASIPTKNYKEVIEVRVPTRFYWNEDDSFDGVEFGEFKTTLQPWEKDMIRRCLEAISPTIECKEG